MPFLLASLVADRIARRRSTSTVGRHRANGGPSWSEVSIETFVSELRP